MNAGQRQAYILNSLKQRDCAEITWLSQQMQVSDMTVRRDLSRMEEEGLLLRVHGGARALPQGGYEPMLNQRVLIEPAAKHAIGRYAAGLVAPGDVIAIDASSTAHAMLPYLDVPVTVLTNAIGVAVALAENSKVAVILLGGKLRKPSLSLVGASATEMMANYHADKVFLSAKAADLTHGLTDATADEGEVKRAMLCGGSEIYLLADHSKLATCAFYRVCPIPRLHHLITNQSAERTPEQNEFIEGCRSLGLQIHEIGGTEQ